jgi:hypothetical protein
MKKLLVFRRGRYALAALALMLAVVAAAACNPTKSPLKQPAQAPCETENGATGAACLKIEPVASTFGLHETKTFTVTNLGPFDSSPLKTELKPDFIDVCATCGGLYLIDSQHDTCVGIRLAVGKTCTLGVTRVLLTAPGGSTSILRVSSVNSQFDSVLGSGVVARLTAS